MKQSNVGEVNTETQRRDLWATSKHNWWLSERVDLWWQLCQHSGQDAREITQGTEVSQGFSSQSICPKAEFRHNK